MASDTFKNIAQLAEKVGTISSDVVEYGLASEPICGVSQVAAWKAMPSLCASRPLEGYKFGSAQSGAFPTLLRNRYIL